MNWKDKVKKFGNPIQDHIYECKVKNFNSGNVQDHLLIFDETEQRFLTADDKSEIDEWNWDVIEWKKKEPQPTKKEV